MIRQRNSKGFTLIEILVAMAIASVVAMISVNALGFALRAKTIHDNKSEQLSALQFAYVLMQNDIEQALNRPIRNNQNQVEAGFWGESLHGITRDSQAFIAFTRGGVTNSQWRQAKSALARVQYAIEGDKLIRITWQALDQAPTSEPIRRVILRGIRNLECKFISHDAIVFDTWKTALEPEDFTLSENVIMDRVPQGVRISFELDELGYIDWLFTLAGVPNEPLM